MSSLSSSSTDAQVWAAYDDNASFEENASPSQAAAFITACKILLRRRPQMMTVAGQGSSRAASFDVASIREQLARATRWYAVNRSGTAGGVRFIDYGDLRT